MMKFYVYRNEDGTIHVQNVLMGHFGQHHVHNEDGFNKWKEGVLASAIEVMEGCCNCDLKPSQVRNHTGKVWTNDKF
jgi:hypothetical protein